MRLRINQPDILQKNSELARKSEIVVSGRDTKKYVFVTLHYDTPIRYYFNYVCARSMKTVRRECASQMIYKGLWAFTANCLGKICAFILTRI